MPQDSYQACFEQSQDVLFVIGRRADGDFVYREVNAALLRDTGLSREQIVGKTPRELLPVDQAAPLEAVYAGCFASGEPALIESILDVPSGSRSWQVQLSPLRDGRGEVIELLGSARDITWSRDFAQQLQTVAPHLPGFVYQLSWSGGDDWRFLFVGERVEVMFGVSQAEVLADAGALLDRIHPEDYERVIGESIAHGESLTPWQGEFRMRHRDGSLRWVEANDLPQRLADGTIIWTGYVNDISRRKALEAEVWRSETRFRQLVENANDIIYTLTPDGVLSYVSPSWVTSLGHAVEDVVGTHIRDYLHPDDLPRCLAFLEEVLGSGEPRGGIEYRVRHRDDGWRWHTSNAAPLRDDDGQVTAFLGIARDITERRAMEERIRHLAQHDALTGLPNRALFFEHLEQALRLAARHGEKEALLFIDLDEFKPINDRLGHAAGDEVLLTTARRLLAGVRESDLVGRLGGDEFVVLLHAVGDSDEALAVAGALCRSLAEPIGVEGQTVAVSASIGVTLYPDHAVTGDDLVRAADRAMYRAKAAGRNRAELAQRAQRAGRPR
ncbi:diguanylate cyclase [Guyparkeria hydrothermalis]|uniref:diguanylate cyclase domain-containing protein n=1 Tax=Guyparkeria hydrothermalis TaxID=923 RepID=UPI002021D035|nr:diguanylate cyclase [Guyparkeria hydrothermalis]MCL7751077.1 diguanylate cyclase [Guyparkeria hydrothermalis]